MKRLASTLVALFALGAPVTSNADVFSDELAKCLVTSTSSEDKVALMRWAFVQVTNHPGVQDLSAVSAQQRKSVDIRVARLYERLLTENCRAETINVAKFGGQDAMEEGFKVLGGVASRGLFEHASVKKGTTSFVEYLDEEAFKGVFDVK